MSLGNSLSSLVPNTIMLSAVSTGEVPSSGRAFYTEAIKEFSSLERQNSFLAGRYASKKSLESLGFKEDFEIIRHDSGRPIFPQGFIGSISHSDDLAISVVTNSPEILSIGVDIQLFRSTKEGLRERILTNKETDLDVLAVFSAKEAVYKATSPLVSETIGFKDVVLSKTTQGFIGKIIEPEQFELEFSEIEIISELIDGFYFSLAVVNAELF